MRNVIIIYLKWLHASWLRVPICVRHLRLLLVRRTRWTHPLVFICAMALPVLNAGRNKCWQTGCPDSLSPEERRRQTTLIGRTCKSLGVR